MPSSTDITLNSDEQDCEYHFVSTHSRDATGRYVIHLPLKNDPTVLGDSKTCALACLKKLSQRMSSDPLYQERYKDFIEEYRILGHLVSAASEDEKAIPTYYLPHHGVIREHSSTTKLRVVFNGSSRTSNGMSLNDILHAGAKLQSEISDVLLWTRMHRYIFSTDIIKMFRQIKVHSDDWNLQRILWIGQNEQPVVY